MALSVLSAFAKFLNQHNYSTLMWESGYGQDAANDVCHELTAWARDVFQIDGEFLMLWTHREDTRFFGDSELAYAAAGKAYLVPNPFLEGDAEGFVTALHRIVENEVGELYAVDIQGRVLYNAV